MPDFKNTVKYDLPNNGDTIDGSGVVAKGSFSVEYTYREDGTYKSAAIVSSNITTSGGTNGNTIYNNTFNEKSSNTFDALNTRDTTRDSRPVGDHVGASVVFNDTTGAVTVKFQELQANTINPEPQDRDWQTSDYNELNFTFLDSAAKSGLDADSYLTQRTLTIDNITEYYDRANSNPTAISDIGGTPDTLSAACYTKGTLIMTATGEVAVEDLSVGDQVMTVSGTLEPVIWLGNSTIHCERQLHKDKAYPVRIVKDAFGTNLPKRDLFLSPDHSVYIDGVMIPAYCLINGTTITQAQTETIVTYYHVELPQHQAILAEGLPAESYLETSEENRHFFTASSAQSNVTKLDAQYPVCPENTPAWKHIWDTQGFAPLTQSGPVLEAVQAKLAVRAEEFVNIRIAA